MVGVHFTEIEDFLDELDRHAEDLHVQIERNIVRATPTYRAGAAGIKTVSVMASFVSTRELSLPELIHVNAPAGHLWGHDEQDERTNERRDAMMEAIRGACQRLVLDLRAGWFEGIH